MLVTADEPGQHSSQNEQDNRQFGKFAKVPVIEPTDSQEAKDWVKIAFEISEEFNTPVIFRTTTRISHSKSVVEFGEREERPPVTELVKDMPRFTMLPVYSRARHPLVEQRLKDLAVRGDTLPINQVEMGDTRVGIVASGVAYQYAREAFPTASFLKLGMTYPVAMGLVEEFRGKVDRLYVVEELDPFIEEQIRLAGIQVDGGKDILPMCGEFDPGLVARTLHAAGVPGVDESLLVEPVPAAEGLPNRPPTLCPGCSHRAVFAALSKLKVFVNGDIGCYTLGAMPPFNAIHTTICMGAGIGMSHGMSKVVTKEAQQKIQNRVVSVIGDSTFFHSGITGLLDVVWNKSNTVTIIMDNRTTAMTGGQQNPGTGRHADGRPQQHRRHPQAGRGHRRQAHHRGRLVQHRRDRSGAQARDRGRRALGHHHQGALRPRVQDPHRPLGGRHRRLHRLQALPARGLHRPELRRGRGRRQGQGRDRRQPVQRLRRVRPDVPLRGHPGPRRRGEGDRGTPATPPPRRTRGGRP